MRGGILADEMGMGKTIQAISVIVTHRRDDQELVPISKQQQQQQQGAGAAGGLGGAGGNPAAAAAVAMAAAAPRPRIALRRPGAFDEAGGAHMHPQRQQGQEQGEGCGPDCEHVQHGAAGVRAEQQQQQEGGAYGSAADYEEDAEGAKEEEERAGGNGKAADGEAAGAEGGGGAAKGKGKGKGKARGKGKADPDEGLCEHLRGKPAAKRRGRCEICEANMDPRADHATVRHSTDPAPSRVVCRRVCMQRAGALTETWPNCRSVGREGHCGWLPLHAACTRFAGKHQSFLTLALRVR